MKIQHCLSTSSLFGDLDEAEIERLAQKVIVKKVASGDFIYREGEVGSDIYLIASGAVDIVYKSDTGQIFTIGCMGQGSHFGETTLLTGKHHSVGIRASTKTKLLIITEKVFHELFDENSVVHNALERSLAERLQLSFYLLKENSETLQKGSASLESVDTPVLGTSYLNQPSELNYAFEQSRLFTTVRRLIEQFATNRDPVLITGEAGTGKRLVAKQVHLRTETKDVPYIQIDLRQFDPWVLQTKLFGRDQEDFVFTEGRQPGIIEQVQAGTIVLYHAEELNQVLQRKLVNLLQTGLFTNGRGEKKRFPARILFICRSNFVSESTKENIFIPQFKKLLSKQVITIPALREHKIDIPNLVNHYLEKYSRQEFKNISNITPRAVGVLMNYDWPGNINELSNVIQRAVIVSEDGETLSEQILLGLPRTEGKQLFDLLRVEKVRKLFTSHLFPVLPMALITVLVIFGLGALILGPSEADHNIGITLGWYIGWPLLIMSFFFLPRFWCSVCSMAVPGRIVQYFYKPKRKLPSVISNYSGWIVTALCLGVFWVEIVWNAYQSPALTAGIILFIATGSLVFSILYKRRAWCRYICPLGAMNAIFSMPSILELRANRHLCANRCDEYSCYTGTDRAPGCPMFRHPYLVDNNRDCTLCGNCVKNCPHQSIQLNLRLAPQELWNMETPRLSDSFLVMGLAAIFFFLARHQDTTPLFIKLGEFLGGIFTSPYLIGSVLLWGTVAGLFIIFMIYMFIQSRLLKSDYRRTLALYGYGAIPLVLGGYLAVYVKMFVTGAGRLLPNFYELMDKTIPIGTIHLLTDSGVTTIQHIIVLGGMLCTLYANYRITSRLRQNRELSSMIHFPPAVFNLILGMLFVATF